MEFKNYYITNTKESLGSKVKTEQAVVGHWYKLSEIEGFTRYGKVVAINEDGSVDLENVFEAITYNPYGTKWYQNLSWLIK